MWGTSIYILTECIAKSVPIYCLLGKRAIYMVFILKNPELFTQIRNYYPIMGMD